MSAISRISTNTPWEPIVGYSRLVRAGDLVAVSGTTATDDRGMIVGAGQMYVQARQALVNIRTALERAGLAMHHVIRTRMFVTDMDAFCGSGARAQGILRRLAARIDGRRSAPPRASRHDDRDRSRRLRRHRE